MKQFMYISGVTCVSFSEEELHIKQFILPWFLFGLIPYFVMLYFIT